MAVDNSGKKRLIQFTFRQINDSIDKYKYQYNEYQSLKDYLDCVIEDYAYFCEALKITVGDVSNFEEILEYQMESVLPEWMGDYYFQLEELVAESDFLNLNDNFITGLKARAFSDASDLVNGVMEIESRKQDLISCIINESGNDILALYQNLYIKAVKAKGKDDENVGRVFRSLSDIIMQIETQGMQKEEFYADRMKAYEDMLDRAEDIDQTRQERMDSHGEEEVVNLTNSLITIVNYSEVDEELAENFKEHVKAYLKEPNKNGNSDDISLLRKRLSKEFVEIYLYAFLKSMEDNDVPTVLKMFFNFGYVDEELAGIENAVYLYHMADNMPTDPENGIYSYYEWLTAIYNGEKDPGRNEFDVDYAEYLRDEVHSRRITKEEERERFEDKVARVSYEIENVFPVVNKTTTGRITTYCPLLSEHNILKEPESMLLDEAQIKEGLNKIRSLDFGAYYRQTVYTKPEIGINKEYIYVEVLPDIIYTPNVGSRAIMWQEIEGKRRTTPARMFLSALQQEDVYMQLIKLTGMFRWEMCKREQGSRWNDVTDKSLTSIYFDYIQYYRKNKDLNAEAKERIKNDLARSKNSFREMFVRDYITWIMYESSGSPRLNKVSRNILFEFVPFSLSVREKLLINPMYKEIIERYEIRKKAKLHRLDNLSKKIQNGNHQVPEEILEQIKFTNA